MERRHQFGWRTLLSLPAAVAAGLSAAAIVIASRGLGEDEIWYSAWAGGALAVCAGLMWVAGPGDRTLAAAAATAGFGMGIGHDVAGPASLLELGLSLGGLMWLSFEAWAYRWDLAERAGSDRRPRAPSRRIEPDLPPVGGPEPSAGAEV